MIRLLTLSSLAALAAVAIVVTAPAPATAQACGFQAFDSQFRDLTTNQPQRSHWGARDTYQYSYFLGVRGLQILEGHRPCMSGADYEANRQALTGMRDQGLRGCQQLSTNPNSCTPTYPG